MKFWGLLTILAVTAGNVAANDTAMVGQGGRWKRQGAGKTTVQMVRESVVLTLDREDSYTVLADFEFKNHGPTTTVQMGFPEFGGGDMSGDDWKRRTAFLNFETRVDGKKVPVKRQVKEAAEEFYDAFWVKTVKFGAAQTRKIRVQYRAPYGAFASPVRYFALYSFTGGNWRGEVQSSVLTVRMTIPGAYIVGPEVSTHRPTFVRQGQNFIYTWKNWKAEDSFKFRFVRTTENWLGWRDADPRDPGLFAVKIPGTAKAKFQWAPPAFVRDGRTYVQLTELARRTEDTNLAIKFQLKPDKVTVHRNKYRCELSRHNPLEYLQVTTSDEFTYGYVSLAKLERELKCRSKVDPKQHSIEAPL